MNVKHPSSLWPLLILLFSAVAALMIFLSVNITLPGEQLSLNAEEKQWLRAHPKVSIGLDPEYAPFEFYEDGLYSGMSIDYLNWIETKLPIQFEYVTFDNWNQVLAAAYAKQVDMTGALIKTDSRGQYLLFTDSFYTNFDIILIRTDQKTIKESDLVHLKTAVIKDYAVVNFLKDKYPGIQLIEVNNITEGLKQLSFGDLDAFVTDFTQASFYIQKYGYQNIYAIEDSKISIDGDLRFGVRKDYAPLVSILNKALKHMPTSTSNEIHMKWTGVKLRSFLSEKFLIAILTILGLITIVAAIALALNQLLKREIAAKTKTIQAELDYITQVEAELLSLNETLEAKVQERTLTLEQAIHDLHQTQEQMIESEKMASLGGLVAGVAHEINTPLGVTLTSASYLTHISQKFYNKFQNDSIKKSELNSYLEAVLDSSKLMNTNLNKAADLVRSFKQLALDQNSDEKKCFSLKESCDVVIISLYHEYETRHIQIINQIPETLLIESYPGVFSQIFSNILINALQHAFDEKSEGEVIITCTESPDQLCLTLSDNGSGLTDEASQHIFEPFFTTRRYKGNSGLGMHVVYNLVNQKLKGSIQVSSHPAEGTVIKVCLPRIDLNC